MSNRWPDRLVVGLTGNIATGKSAVMEMAAARGALVLDADRIVHHILDTDRRAQKQIVSAFGSQVALPDGRIDRPTLARIVFQTPVALQELERIIHPRVRERLFDRINGDSSQIVFIEAIKLLEGGLADECDQIWVTRCPVEVQIERLVSLRGMDEATAVMRVEAQAPQEGKVAKADVVIDTSGTMADTQAQFELAWNRLLRRMAVSVAGYPPSGKPVDGQPVSGSRDVAVVEQEEPTELAAPKLKAPGSQIDGVLVRRARPTDIPAILLLFHQVTRGAGTPSRGELLLALGERGYLIGQKGTTISTVAGWTAENQVAIIEQFIVSPPEETKSTGAAVLWEIEHTANELICEAILAFPSVDDPEEVNQLLLENGFAFIDSDSLPEAWQSAVAEVRPVGSSLMLKQLRDIRKITI